MSRNQMWYNSVVWPKVMKLAVAYVLWMVNWLCHLIIRIVYSEEIWTNSVGSGIELAKAEVGMLLHCIMELKVSWCRLNVWCTFLWSNENYLELDSLNMKGGSELSLLSVCLECLLTSTLHLYFWIYEHLYRCGYCVHFDISTGVFYHLKNVLKGSRVILSSCSLFFHKIKQFRM